MDLFFDEENDDWNDENFYDDQSDMKTFSRESNSYESITKHSKRPLEAISLRQPKNLQTTEQKKLPYVKESKDCLLYTSPSPRDRYISRMPSSA